MFEVILLVLVMFVMAACAFFPLGYSMVFFSKSAQQSTVANQVESTADSELRILEESNHLLTRLISEIESSFGPRPTDSVLRRHYNTLVASELETRLAALAK
ncbi:hypothetical protein [Methylobacter luteus]|uniref:hypothetical protein n=1 Tax=Methylobacter luteus TaxID=415 RepID=UPI0004840084|nr:hypothetical protein [Methylobacter luteus]